MEKEYYFQKAYVKINFLYYPKGIRSPLLSVHENKISDNYRSNNKLKALFSQWDAFW